MDNVKRIAAQLCIAGALMLGLTGVFAGTVLYAQEESSEVPQFSEEELKQFQDLYGSPTSDGDTLQYPDGGYDYSGGASFPGAGGDPLGSLFGGGGGLTAGLLLASLMFSLGQYVWIPVVLYFLVLLFFVFVLYASVFKRFKKFSREQSLVFAWNETKKHIWFFVLVSLVQLIVYALLAIPLIYLLENSTVGGKEVIPYAGWYSFALSLALFFFFWLFTLGTTKITLKFVDNARASIADLFAVIKYFPQCFLGAILYFFVVFGPYILLGIGTYLLSDKVSPLQLGIGTLVIAVLLAIPVSNWFLKFYLYYMVAVDKGAWPLRALKLASQYSKGAKTDLALLLALLFAVTWAGSSVPFALGLFMAMPIATLAFSHTYRQLEKNSQ